MMVVEPQQINDGLAPDVKGIVVDTPYEDFSYSALFLQPVRY